MTSTASDPTRLVVVGCSWGGLEAVSTLLDHLPEDSLCALAVAQHRGPIRSALTELWARHTTWPVLEPDDKQPILARHVFVAPPAYHLMVEGDHLALSTEAPLNHSRPSIDVLFDSAAKAWGHRVVAVVLTGANADGSAGAAAVAARGGVVVVQEPGEAAHPQMPTAALAAVPSATVLALADIGPHLGRLCRSASHGVGSSA
ncbi:MAG TPA: chemotaxis protein CheB, partial [Acidimicrobiales bacterium]|nr:chemotaxis protein CheB [Acidimicrobiales bacterium]